MVTETRQAIDKPLKVIHESVFPTGQDLLTENGNVGGTYAVDLQADSYIWTFTGGRGAGKSTLMTYFAMWANYKYGLRIVSNYDIEYILQRKYSREHIKSEPLDLYRLFCFEHDYDDCLILMDEAPDIISHMAAQTWKNRLLNVFVRQIRKNHNHLFLGAQYFELIDKSMRQQVDLRLECQDASRKYGWGKHARGMCILCRIIDQSGLWTGVPYGEMLNRLRANGDYDIDPAQKTRVFSRFLWADTDENPGRPVFDSFTEFDVWESLRRVDMKLQTYAVGDNQTKEAPSYMQIAQPILEHAMNEGIVTKADLFKAFGVNETDKKTLGRRLKSAGAKYYGASNSKYNFENFSLEDFFKE